MREIFGTAKRPPSCHACCDGGCIGLSDYYFDRCGAAHAAYIRPEWGQPTDFLDALFTATSATCVTGLVTVGTATHWSGFGQVVILLLIQIGGLGFMSLASIASFLTRRTITLRERMVMSAGLNLTENAGIVRLTRRVLLGTLAFEGAGALLLATRFVPRVGLWQGIKMGVFHSVSAFCNAGFDLIGTPDNPFASLTGYADDWLVNLTIMALIVIGGLGFSFGAISGINAVSAVCGCTPSWCWSQPHCCFVWAFC